MNQEHSFSTAVGAAPALFLPLLAWLGSSQIPTQSNLEIPVTRQTPQEELFDQLNAQLLGLSVRAYERLIAHVLCAAGYENVRILRDHRIKRRSHKGRNRHGGIDITAQVRTEFNTQAVLVQVKQYKRPISRRFVDELRGALLRTQARQGLLITTSVFAPGARRAACDDHIGPIHLIDGVGLHHLLVRYHLGVSENRKGRLYLRQRFFRRLEKQFMEDRFEVRNEIKEQA